jgi:hypothetical protein
MSFLFCSDWAIASSCEISPAATESQSDFWLFM